MITMRNPYMSNYKELCSYANNYNITESNAINAMHKVRTEKEVEIRNTSIGKPITKGQLKVNEYKIDTGTQTACTKLNEEDVTEIKESTKLKKKNKALSDIEKWLNTTIFENGKYTKMDNKTVISLAKYMFDLGYNFRETGNIKLK